MRKIKRLLAGILAVALLITLLPTAVLAAGNVHEVDSAAGLQSVLGTIATGDTIRLAEDIVYPSGITIIGKNITFDLNSHNLNVTSASGTALSVHNGGKVLLSGAGELNVSGEGYGVEVTSGGSATVTNAAATGNGCVAASASGGMITVRNNATAEGMISRGAYATGSSSSVTVSGNVTASKGYNQGAYAENGGIIVVGGNAAVDGECGYGVYAADSGTVTVEGNVAAGKNNCHGVRAEPGGMVTVRGDITIDGMYSYGAFAMNSTITIDGSIAVNNANSYGVGAESAGRITVNGNITANKSNSYGAFVNSGGIVTIEGVMTATIYILLNNVVKNVSSGVRGSSPYEDYFIYAGGTSTVRARIHPSISIKATVLPAAVEGMAYSRKVEADYIGTGTVTFSATGLPGGLSIHTGTGVVSGKPDAATSLASPYNVMVYATDGLLTDSRSFLLVVNAPAAVPVINTQPADVTRNIGQTANFTVAATAPDGGTLSYRWQRSTNGGVTWNNITGAGATSASYTTGTLTLTNNANQYRCVVTNTKNGTTATINSNAAILTVKSPAVSITTAALPAATVGSAYSQTIGVDYTGTGTLTFSAAGLPGGLAISAGTGLISGTPDAGADASSPYTVEVYVTDGTLTASRSFSLVVNAALPANNAPTARNPVPAQRVAENGTVSFNASDIAQDADNDTLTITNIVTGPANVTATAALNSGTVTIAGVLAGSTSVIVRVSDGTDTVNVTVPITVIALPPTISPTSVSYDLAGPADISTIITWNSARSVTDIVYGSDYLTTPAAYAVSGNTLTIKGDYLFNQGFSEGDTAEFEITFDTGCTVILMVNIVNNYTLGSDATLSDLTVGGNTVSGFASGTYTYNVELTYGTQPGGISATVGATPSDSKATINISQATSLPGSATVKVTAEDSTTTRTYALHFTMGTAPNTAPNRRSGVPAAVTAIVTVHNSFTLNLSTIFEDADADPLTYKVSVNRAAYIGAAANYSYTSASVGDTILVFKANDGTADSTDTYTVMLTADAAAPQTYALTITADTGGNITTGTNGNYAAGTVIIIAATPFGNYGFKQWTSTGGGTFGSTTSAGTTFTMPAKAVTITAEFTYNGRRRTSSTSAPTYYADVSWAGTATTLPIIVNTGSNSATVNVGAQQDDIATSGATAVITVPSVPGVIGYILGIPADYLSGPDGDGMLIFITDAGRVTFSTNMLADVAGAEGKKAEIIIGQGDRSRLPQIVNEAIGNRPLIQLAVAIDGKQTEWNNPDTPVTVSIPYIPAAVELVNPESIIIWYIDGNGNAVSVPNSRYDPETGMVTFTTTHFSYYAVTYVYKTFGDLNGVEWARKSIEVLTSKGILKGVSENEYAPQENITRADFLYFLVRTLGVDAKTDGNFEDISSDAYYYKEIAIAKKLGITRGAGNNKFSPDASITRQDMIVLAGRALGILKKLEVQGVASDLDRFADKSLVAAYAVNSVASVLKEGLIVGSGDKVNPLGNATRAEAAAFLYRIYNKLIAK